jgi:calcium homeostasis ER protein
MAPIIESCTKDSISLGKGWIFTKSISHDSNKLIAHYLAFRVTDDSASFSLKLHLVKYYLFGSN